MSSSSPAAKRSNRWGRRKPGGSFDDSAVGLPAISQRERYKRTPSGSMDDSSLNMRTRPTAKPPSAGIRFRRSKSIDTTSNYTPRKGNRLKATIRKLKPKWKKKSSKSEDDDVSEDESDGGMLAKVNSYDSDQLSDLGMEDTAPSGFALSDPDDGVIISSSYGRNRQNNSGEDSEQARGVSFDFSAMSDNKTTSTTRSNESSGVSRNVETAERRPRGQRARYSIYQNNSTTKRKSRVRPYHCFTEGAKYMTEEDIYSDSLEPTEKYEFLKSYLAPPSKNFAKKCPVDKETRKMWGSPKLDGRIGAIRVEVLGCISLSRTKPDVSVYLVCGDSAFTTDVVQGFRSPMWPKNSRRGAVFPIHHAYASFYVGVFDVKKRKKKENDAYCGRVAIDIASLRPDTDYDITLPLRASSFIYDRKKRGVIRLRFALHWFSERAAVVSYFKPPASLLASSPLVEGQPTIPCADPKTFRNVAITVYGMDMPGKYTRNAFRATMREFNLYQTNVRYTIKLMFIDAMMYEKPAISLYLLFASMYCVATNSVRMVPPFVILYFLIRFAENYYHFVVGNKYNFGYKPVTGIEIANALLAAGDAEHPSFAPLLAKKKTKQRSQKMAQKMRRMNSQGDDDATEMDGDIQAMNHREFPFSEKNAYPKFGVEDALAPSSKKAAGGNARLHGRLSVYYAATPTTPAEGEGAPVEEDESSDEDSDDNDDETIVSESGMGDSMFMDLEGEDEDEMMNEGEPFGASSPYGETPASGATERPRIKVGPPQNTETKGRKIPPQVHLKRIENILHKISKGVSVEMVHPPVAVDGAEAMGSLSVTTDAVKAQLEAIKKKKVYYDEFDKMLGLQTRNPNPVLRIASGFLGPLMRMIRILVYLMRVSFNMATWRDPYLSSWMFLFLSVVCFILVIFPWRTFFFVTSLLCLGPQNVLVRKYLERKQAKKEKEAAEKAADEQYYGQGAATSQAPPSGKPSASAAASYDGQGRRFRPFGGSKRPDSNGDNSGLIYEERPPFSSHGQTKTNSNKKVQARPVAIPYSRFRKERFYDWPPDPTVSRATPLMGNESELGVSDNAPLPEMIIPVELEIPSMEQQSNASRRRRNSQ